MSVGVPRGTHLSIVKHKQACRLIDRIIRPLVTKRRCSSPHWHFNLTSRQDLGKARCSILDMWYVEG